MKKLLNTPYWDKGKFRRILMRLTMVKMVLIFSLLNTYASVYSQTKISNLSLNKIELSEALKSIEKLSDYTFIFNYNDVMGHKVTAYLKDMTIDECMKIILKDSPFEYKVEGDIIIVSYLKMPLKQKEKIEIKGKVTDKKGNPLPGVSVVIKGTQIGVSTDIDGKFNITVDEMTGGILIFSFVGMETKEVKYVKNKYISVLLEEDSEQLDEVVVVGYGAVRKKDITGSISSIKGDELMSATSSTFDKALGGKISGVYASQGSGAPGSGGIMHIRGVSSINGDNQPLYVIDGLPVVVNPGGISGVRENPLLSINSFDIESIDVLKDASAAAIYGARAANGVVIVTTKRGKKGQKAKVDFGYRYTVQNPVKINKMMGAEEYKTYLKIIANQGLQSAEEQAHMMAQFMGYPSEMIPELIKQIAGVAYDVVNSDSYFGNADTDWNEVIKNNNAGMHEWNLGVSGGSKESAYYVNLTSTEQDGVIKGYGLKRYGIRGAVDTKVLNRLKLGYSINYNYSENQKSNAKFGSDFRPDVPIYNSDGSFYEEFQDRRKPNPYTNVFDITMTKSKNILSSAFAELDVFDGLKFKTSVNVGVIESGIDNLIPDYTFASVIWHGGKTARKLNDFYSSSVTFDNTLNYNKIFKKHSFSGLLGASWNRNVFESRGIVFRGFPDNKILVNTTAAGQASEFEENKVVSGLHSFFGRFNYGYNDKYLLTLTARSDGSSKFGPGNKWGFFPSGAVAWKMHNEEFIKKIDFISLLKLRLSCGITGYDNLSDFVYKAQFRALSEPSSLYAGVTGIVPTGIPNELIKWETTKQFDLGIQFGVLNNRISGEVGYFTKNTNGIILDANIPWETGFKAQTQNKADVVNKGWEIRLDADILSIGDFSWNSSFNISFISNKIENLRGAGPDPSSYAAFVGSVKEGESLGALIGYRVEKIFQNQDEIDELNLKSPTGVYQNFKTSPGDYMFIDLNGDGFISPEDREVIGSSQPDYYGGLNNRFKYGNLNLSVDFRFMHGAKKIWSDFQKWTNFDYGNNFAGVLDKTWRIDNPDAEFPRIVLNGANHNGRTSDRKIRDASFLKLSNVQLSYNLSDLLKNTFIKTAKVYIAASNLWTLTSFPGIDPESGSNAVNNNTAGDILDGGNYPYTKTWSVGVNISF